MINVLWKKYIVFNNLPTERVGKRILSAMRKYNNVDYCVRLSCCPLHEYSYVLKSAVSVIFTLTILLLDSR